MDVYTYWKWDAKTIPHFTQGETLTPTSLFMNEVHPIVSETIFTCYKGETTAAKLLTEEELIGLMDKNGIGTDATIAEHINTILKRGYVVKEVINRQQFGKELLLIFFREESSNLRRWVKRLLQDIILLE